MLTRGMADHYWQHIGLYKQAVQMNNWTDVESIADCLGHKARTSMQIQRSYLSLSARLSSEVCMAPVQLAART